MDTKDSNGTTLNDGDSVQVIKDLKVKGSSNALKRGLIVKNIRLTDDPEHIEYRDGKTTMVLKTCFLKKV
jgi:protein PhnA